MSSTNDPLVILRSAIAAKIDGTLVIGDTVGSERTDDIVKATGLEFPSIPGISNEPFVLKLDTPTAYQITDVDADSGKRFIDTRTVYNCYITKDLSITDYISISDERMVTNLKFLERTDLLTWLQGASTESSNIVKSTSAGGSGTSTGAGSAGASKSAAKTSSSTASSSVVKAKRPIDEELQKIYNQERTLIDHNRALRGNKLLDFSSVSSECRQKILSNYKNGSTANGGSNSIANAGKHKNTGTTSASSTGSTNSRNAPNRIPLPTSGKNQDPIILISPSASSLLNMSNVKEFLETGTFSPVMSSSGAADLIRISRHSAKIGTTRFVVVNSVEKFKPEYWDRVVAVFVTGQAWQFKSYRWSDPNALFQKVLGFALVFRGDPLPPSLTQWNVKVETLDRSQRFRDREASERIWDRIEQSMIARGWPVKR
ncbi:Cdc73p [Sugiyamaella lignohabitans]|uniref:Cdc73p n=1 Tax=Sugiyamaella lignohabitans TaxID=796027 RepID=A0A167FF29_9ASCO|nr:Cdc73p [Sugiyamaella lignohabitans]ANB15219.1 Cdc73p [Sugiyamaella lignohabitans]